METAIPEYPETLKFKRFNNPRLFANGPTFRTVVYHDTLLKKDVFVKMDKQKDPSSILNECLFAKAYYKEMEMPEYIMHDQENGVRYLVMHLIPHTIADYL